MPIFAAKIPGSSPSKRCAIIWRPETFPRLPPRKRSRPGQLRSIGKWVAACKGGPATYGDFLQGGPISDAFNLAAVSLRLGGRKLVFDSSAMRITNHPEANPYLVREYRPGWELQSA